jgi:hypothetical protein
MENKEHTEYFPGNAFGNIHLDAKREYERILLTMCFRRVILRP